MLAGSGSVNITADDSVPLVLSVSASYDKCANQIHISSASGPQNTQWGFGDLALTGSSVDLLFGNVCRSHSPLPPNNLSSYFRTMERPHILEASLEMLHFPMLKECCRLNLTT